MSETNLIGDMSRLAIEESLRLMLGKRLGYGMSRSVYECRINKSLVVKIEEGSRRFQNIMEHEIWITLSGTKAARWLAPIVDISPCGIVLLMKRTTPMREKELPAKVPVWLTDCKTSNFGIYEGRPVCHDYGTAGTVMLSRAVSKAMKNPNWDIENADAS